MNDSSRVRTILFLAANPASTVALDLRAECEAIEESLKRQTKQHTLRLVAQDAATDDAFRRALLDHEPEIVHFSGHGAGRRGLVFEEASEALFISGEALTELLGLCSSHVKCVVLNACYSEVQAQSISSVVEYVVGMSCAIGDNAAIRFSTGFYDALAAGRSFEDSFHFGCNAISLRGIPESLTPTLIIKNHLQPFQAVTGSDRISNLKGGNIRQVSKAQDSSVQELITLLDFRADMIISVLGREKRDALEAFLKAAPTERARDIKLVGFENRLDNFASMFAELHEKNKKALIDGKFVLSHEITKQIQLLLSEVRNTITFWYANDVPVGDAPCYSLHIHSPWECASEYPGPLPESVKHNPNQVVLMWKQEEEARRRAEQEERRRIEEETRRGEAERKRRKAEWEEQRKTVAALQQTGKDKGILKEGDRCPECGFSYAWDGIDCHHCHYHKD
jgi:hypothetical protein